MTEEITTMQHRRELSEAFNDITDTNAELRQDIEDVIEEKKEAELRQPLAK